MSHPAPISVVHIASGDSWAGAEVQLFTLAKALHQLDDISIKVILLNHGELESRLLLYGIPLVILDENQLNGVQIFRRIRKLLKTWQPDLVHTHRLKENILGSLSARLAGNIPTLRTVHGASEHRPGWLKPHKFLINKLNHLSGQFLQYKIVAVSDELAEKMAIEYPVHKIVVIENGVDVEEISSFLSEIDPVSSHDTPPRVGIVGRLVPVKRVDLFIKLAQYMWQNYPDRKIQFHIYGDGPIRKDLEKLIEDLKLDNKVILEGHRNNIYKELASLNALIILSDHEGLPMILLEAMALRVPVIAHSVGGISKVLGNGSCGYLISSQTISDYSLAILDCLDNKEHMNKLVDAAQHQVHTLYNTKQNATKYLDLYRSILLNSQHE